MKALILENHLSQTTLLGPELFPDPPRPWSFYKHQALSLVAVPGVMIAEIMLLSPFPALLKGFAGGMVAAFAFAAGAFAGYRIPRSRDYAVARWTWILPVVLFLVAIWGESHVLGLRRALADYFYPPAGTEGAGWLITLPVGSSVTYSIGAAVGYVRARRSAQRAMEQDTPSGDSLAAGMKDPQ